MSDLHHGLLAGASRPSRPSSRPPGGLPAAAALALLAALLAAVGCADSRTTALVDPRVDQGTAAPVETFVQGVGQVDVLLVVDDTIGMKPAQAALLAATGPLLVGLDAAQLDWRIGVISTDLGIYPYSGPGCTVQGGGRGVLLRAPRLSGCVPPTGSWVTRATLDPKGALACIASLGEEGCGFEQPLGATLLALDPAKAPAENAGFLRDGAGLLIVWLSNEDDCTAKDAKLYDPDALALGAWTGHRCFAQDIVCTGEAPDGSLTGCASGKTAYLRPVRELAAALLALRPAGALQAVAVVGPAAPVKVTGSGAETALEPSCSEGALSARPALRFHELALSLAGAGTLVSLCASGLEGELVAAATRLARPPYHCLRHALRDPARPGCAVTVTASGQSWSLAPSAAGTAGYHLIHPVNAGCPAGALAFDPGAEPPVGATVELRCDFQGS